jgi:two-component system, cell cycle response regulator
VREGASIVAAVNESEQATRKHIFVINGAPAFLNLMRALLQSERYIVTTTNFVPNSFAQIEDLQPDVLVIDLAHGEQVGWELLERLHSEASTMGIPVLIVSTVPRFIERAREQVARYGGNAYLSKPFRLEAMLQAIDGLIGPP